MTDMNNTKIADSREWMSTEHATDCLFNVIDVNDVAGVQFRV